MVLWNHAQVGGCLGALPQQRTTEGLFSGSVSFHGKERGSVCYRGGSVPVGYPHKNLSVSHCLHLHSRENFTCTNFWSLNILSFCLYYCLLMLLFLLLIFMLMTGVMYYIYWLYGFIDLVLAVVTFHNDCESSWAVAMERWHIKYCFSPCFSLLYIQSITYYFTYCLYQLIRKPTTNIMSSVWTCDLYNSILYECFSNFLD